MKLSGSNHWQAIFCALLGFTCWTCGDMFMKLAVELGAAKHEIMVIGGFSGMAAVFTVSFLRGNLGKLRPRSPRRLLLLACTFLFNYVCFLVGLPHLPLANYYTIIFVTPMAVAVIATVFLHEPLTREKGAGIVAGFIGVLVALDPLRFHFSPDEWIGYSAAFGSMFVVVVQMLALRFLGSHETRECLAFYPRFGAVAGGIGAMLFLGIPVMPVKAIYYSLATGCIGGLGWLAMAQAYRLARAATVAPFHYSQIISGMIIGFFVWHDVPGPHLLGGAAIIIASGLYIAAHAHKTEKLLEKQII